mgnify:CR=1 FL=1
MKTNLFGKLFTLAINKVASIDPSGIGIEMEADKPDTVRKRIAEKYVAAEKRLF